MAAPLIIPDFIKQARLAAIGAGIPCGTDDATTAVLMLAATAYNRIPQVNRAEMLRQDLAKTQDELENVSSNLLAERKKSARLQATLDELQATTSSPQMLASYKAACKQQGALMKENHHLKQQLAGVKRKQASALWQQIL